MSKNVIVLGGSKGVGFTIACKLASEGYNTIIVGRDKKRLMEAQLLAKQRKISLQIEVADATKEQDIEELFLKIEYLQSLDIFVNCVGKNLSQTLVKKDKSGAILKHEVQDFKRIIELNLISAFIGGREAARFMISKNTEGVIINITTALYQGAYGQSAYTAAKSGVTALTYTWALELSKYGIRCVSIAPGAIVGAALIQACEKSESHANYMNKLREQIPLKRFVAEEEVADSVYFAATNKYLTGTILKLDGGGLPPKVVF